MVGRTEAIARADIRFDLQEAIRDREITPQDLQRRLSKWEARADRSEALADAYDKWLNITDEQAQALHDTNGLLIQDSDGGLSPPTVGADGHARFEGARAKSAWSPIETMPEYEDRDILVRLDHVGVPHVMLQRLGKSYYIGEGFTEYAEIPK